MGEKSSYGNGQTLQGRYTMNSQQMEVIDLLINILREHEKKLDQLISRLEKIPALEDWK